MQFLLNLVDIHYNSTRKFVKYELTISVDKIELLVYNINIISIVKIESSSILWQKK